MVNSSGSTDEGVMASTPAGLDWLKYSSVGPSALIANGFRLRTVKLSTVTA